MKSKKIEKIFKMFQKKIELESSQCSSKKQKAKLRISSFTRNQKFSSFTKGRPFDA